MKIFFYSAEMLLKALGHLGAGHLGADNWAPRTIGRRRANGRRRTIGRRQADNWAPKENFFKNKELIDIIEIGSVMNDNRIWVVNLDQTITVLVSSIYLSKEMETGHSCHPGNQKTMSIR